MSSSKKQPSPNTTPVIQEQASKKKPIQKVQLTEEQVQRKLLAKQ